MVGGKGTRLMPLTETKPKPILSVVDKPCIWYLIRSLARAGIEEVILACGYKPGMMEELGDGSDLGIRIRYAYEDEPMGTAGAMKLLEDQLDDTFVASNGDVFADIDVAEEIGVHQDTDAKITIALTPVTTPASSESHVSMHRAGYPSSRRSPSRRRSSPISSMRGSTFCRRRCCPVSRRISSSISPRISFRSSCQRVGVSRDTV